MKRRKKKKSNNGLLKNNIDTGTTQGVSLLTTTIFLTHNKIGFTRQALVGIEPR